MLMGHFKTVWQNLAKIRFNWKQRTGGVQYQRKRLPLVVAVAYRFASQHIKFVGTQAQYDTTDAATVENQP